MSTKTENAEVLMRRAIEELKKARTELNQIKRAQKEPIAIIGMGCRFPGKSNNPKAFWQLLYEGRDAISEVPLERWDMELVDRLALSPNERRAIRWAGFLDGVDQFDPAFFGISPREASQMDPQQRLLLEVAWEALENAGIASDSLAGLPVGVFVGAVNTNDYSWLHSDPNGLGVYDAIGNTNSVIAGRLSYLLNLQGPSIVIDTACSSSLVAVHLACQSLRNRESKLALAGGVNVILSPRSNLLAAKLQALSPDGRCRTFDAQANGFVRGEGCGVVILKRLEDALADQDQILAVIRGSAVNQDGRSTGLTAPNVLSQKALIRQALQNAKVPPSEISYIEAHGTGTPLGDPIEVAALNEVYGQNNLQQSVCSLGSVKTNIGHLEAAAGIAGLIKVVLSLQYETIPAHLNFKRLNPRISSDGDYFTIPVVAQNWSKNGKQRFAAVSSFGVSGTNAHIILEEAPEVASNSKANDKQEINSPENVYLLPLSARSPKALTELAQGYREFLSSYQYSLYDLCYSASLKRNHHHYRLAIVASSYQEMLEKLANVANTTANIPTNTQGNFSTNLAQISQPTELTKLVFVFPGQGSQWFAMGKELIQSNEIFRETITQCQEAMRPYINWLLTDVLQGIGTESSLDQVDVIQPALFAMQVAIAAVWRSWGVEPDAVVGHSMGEVVAAFVGGYLSLEDACQLICLRSQLVKRSSGKGAMALVELSWSEAMDMVASYQDEVSVAASNGPKTTLLSGLPSAIDEILHKLEAQGLFGQKVKVDYASHCTQMDELLPELRKSIKDIKPQLGKVPFYSTVTCRSSKGGELDANYWADNLRKPVKFWEIVNLLSQEGHNGFLEISAHPILLPNIENGFKSLAHNVVAIASLRREQPSLASLLKSLGILYCHSYQFNWQHLYHKTGKFLSLPTYPWQKDRFWVEEPQSNSSSQGFGWKLSSKVFHPLLGECFKPASPANRTYWEQQLFLKAIPYLYDHQVLGQVVFPAAAFIEMALAAATQEFGHKSFSLSNFSFKTFMELTEKKARTIQVILTKEKASLWSVQIVSRESSGPLNNDSWVEHMSGNIQLNKTELNSNSLPLKQIRNRLVDELATTEFYQQMNARGLTFGHSFQGLHRLWYSNEESLGELCIAENLCQEMTRYQIHPVLLDVCFQALAATFFQSSKNEKASYVPIAIESLTLYQHPQSGSGLFSFTQFNAQSNAAIMIGDIILLDETGMVLLEVKGLSAKRLEAERQQLDDLSQSIYVRSWQPSPLPKHIGAEKNQIGNWLIFADNKGVANGLAAQLRTSGNGVILAFSGEKYQIQDKQTYQLRATYQEDFNQLIQDAFNSNSPCLGVVHLWSLITDENEMDLIGLEKATDLGCISALHLTQALVQTGWPELPRLWLMTAGTQAISEKAGVSIKQSPLWGLGQTIMNEHPRLHCTLLDLEANTQQTQTIVRELQAHEKEDQVALRGDTRFVARLTQTPILKDSTKKFESVNGRSFSLEVENLGILDSLFWQESDRREPNSGEVEIEIEYTSLNFIDVLKTMGIYPGQDTGAMALGTECAGRITRLGSNVSGFKVGDPVIALATGTLASHVTTDANLVIAKPERLSMAEAASVTAVFMTAYYALCYLGRIRRGEKILIHSAAGGTGLAAIEIAKWVGAEIFATAGSPEKREFLKSLGIVHVMDSRSLGFAEEILEQTAGQGVDLVLNSLTGEAIPKSLSVLARYGRFLEIGKRDIYENASLGLLPFKNNLSYFAIDLASYLKERQADGREMLKEVISLLAEGSLSPLPVEIFPATQINDAFRLMAQARHIGKIVVAIKDPQITIAVNPKTISRFQLDGSYLITGGLRGIGLVTAQWMASQGVKNLILIGRTEPNKESQEILNKIKTSDVNVVVLKVDIAQTEELSKVLGEAIKDLPPLRGIIHSAAILDDGTLLQLNQERFKSVMAAKVIGSWNLHRLTQNQPLDFFVMFSSAISLIGSPGQGNYAAANAFLDALAHYRHAQGLPALSINWGGWAEVGLVEAEQIRKENVILRGVKTFSPEQGLNILGHFLNQQIPQIGYVHIDWQQWREFNSGAEISPYFSLILQNQEGKVELHKQKGNLRGQILVTQPEQRQQLLESHLREQIGQVLRISPTNIESSMSLASLGLDSLMALEIRNRLENSLGLSLSVTLMLRFKNITSLAEHLLKEVVSNSSELSSTLSKTDISSTQTLTPQAKLRPASAGQQRLWFLYCKEPELPIYNVLCGLRISKPINLTTLRRSLEELIQRHEALRTLFMEKDGVIMQSILDRVEVDLVVEEIPVEALEIKQEWLHQRSKALVQKTFNLVDGPIFRTNLLQLGDKDYALLFCQHHINTDGWSVTILLNELSQLYEAFDEGKPSPLMPLKFQAADINEIQQSDLAGEKGERGRAYWKNRLEGVPLLSLPTDRPVSIKRTHQGEAVKFTIPSTIYQQLKQLAHNKETTLFVVILATYAVLLRRYTDQVDFCIGSITSNRTKHEMQNVLGFFVNTLPLRIDLDGEPTFANLVNQLHQSVLHDLDHQEIPFDEIIRAAGISRDSGLNPLVQAAFVLQNFSFELDNQGQSAWSHLFESPDVAVEGTTKFDIFLSIFPHGEDLHASLEYSTDLFDKTTIERIVENFQILLQSIVDAPNVPITSLPLLTEQEKRQVLIDWNQTQVDFGNSLCIHQLFEHQVEKTPEAIALVFEKEHLSYRELNQHANRLAHYLRKIGIKSESLVGVCVERSVDMVVAILAILKAGGAYVPIDPLYPKDRVNFMLQDSQMHVVLTQEHLVAELANSSAQLLCLDSNCDKFVQESFDNPINLATFNNLSHILYTSGSTGKPKGTAIEHKSIAAFLCWAINFIDKEHLSNVLASTSICFDLSVFELFAPLAVGGRIILVQNALQVPYQPTAQNISLINTVPSAMAELIRLNAVPLSVKTIILAGEPLTNLLAQQINQLQQNIRLLNLYGPTEVASGSTIAVCQKDDSRPPNIGKPLSNLQAYILDSKLQPVPIGAPGEIYMGGAGLARGYLNRPDMTAEKFIHNPFSTDPCDRLYKTGDLAKFLPDGNIEFLGRIDHQVKIRGFRIELGEIESSLLQHPNVEQTVVLAREDSPEAKRLVAYVVSNYQELQVNELRNYLKTKLPEYMVPAVIVLLSEMPLTPNGKIDRKLLPVPSDFRTEQAEGLVLPRTYIEETLTKIWEDVLRTKPIGIYDNFFEFGGDSILSLQIISRAKQAGFHLTPKDIFQHQTIAELAPLVGTNRVTESEQGLVQGPVWLTPIQEWFFEQDFAEPHHWNQPVLLECNPPLQAKLVEQALRLLINHHDVLRLRYWFESGYWQQSHKEIGLNDPLPFTCIDLSNLPEEEQANAIETHSSIAGASLNLTDGPLFRIVLFDLGKGKSNRLLWAVHHLIVDGVSWRILLEQFHSLYQQLSQGINPNLPEKTCSFQKWAQLLLNYAQSDDLATEQGYWLAYKDFNTSCLPLDYPLGNNIESTSQVISVSLSQSETSALLMQVPQAYHTQINDVLLTALTQALARWSASHSLLIALEGHGREEIFEGVDISRTVGWFTSLFPICLNLTNPEDIGESLKSIKEQLRTIPRKGIGYGLLRYLSNDEKLVQQLKSLPAPEVSFNYLGQFEQVLSESVGILFAKESSGIVRSPKAKRCYLLEIYGLISRGQLTFNWIYSEANHRRETIQVVANDFIAALQALIEHCIFPGVVGYTPSDFPLASLKQEQLDELLKSSQQVEDIYPLSPMQQGMLFHSLFAPQDGFYFEQIHCIFDGELNPLAFHQAWQLVTNNHPALRTSVYWEGLNEPLQIVHSSLLVPWSFEDWRKMSETEQKEQSKKLLEEDKRHGFEMSKPPLFRLTLLQLSEKRYQFIWSFHHLLIDGWCLPIIFEEFLKAYQAIIKGQQINLKKGFAYRDYIAWLKKQDVAKAESYWKKNLAGFSMPTSLGITKTATPANQTADYEELSWQLSKAENKRLIDFTRTHQLTLNTLIQGAWALLLSHYSGEKDVVFGTTVSGRPSDLANIEDAVGLFINSIPVRVRFSLEDRILTWLKNLQEQLLESRQYEYCSLADIQTWSEIPHGQSLFESLLVFENYPFDQSLQQMGEGFQILEVQAKGQVNYALTLTIIPNPELQLCIAFNKQFLDQSSIQRIFGHLKTLLEGVICQPEELVASLSPLTKMEREEILLKWNNHQSNYPEQFCIHQLFEAQVEKTPEAIAVVFEKCQLSYLELNQKANQLAHYLKKHGVGPEVLVGICVEHSLEMVIGLLGILKAGAAYLPLDPAYPIKRLDFMIQDAKTPVLLSLEHLTSKLSQNQAKIICLDSHWKEIAQESKANLVSNTTPQNLAYIIYTSGSTGNPKGVEICHQSVVNHAFAFAKHVKLQASDRTLQFASLSFDVAVEELFPAWFSGATVIVRSSEALVVDNFLALLEAKKPTILNLPASYWQEWIRTLAQNQDQNQDQNKDQSQGQVQLPASLRWVVIGSEVVSWEGIRLWQSLPTNGINLSNAYGPTECTVTSTIYDISPDLNPQEFPTIPIGRPLANTQVYILDSRLNPVAIGVTGELYIGGVRLARGYLNASELTAEKFIPNPFSEKHEDRLYKTGDLARYLPDGNIEFLGRTDSQVKIRGFRIELGEIETVIAQYKAIKKVLVLAREDFSNRKQLVAYLVTDEESLEIQLLRNYIKEKLPEYMTPSAFVLLKALPLLPNGKVDTKALPSPNTIQVEPKQGFMMPQNPHEELLVQIWEDVLRYKPIGIYDNFFELGGDSILSIQIVSKAKQAGIQLTLKQIFEYQTIAELAKVGNEPVAISAEQAIVEGETPLTPIQHWLLEQEPPDPHHWNQFFFLEFSQALDPNLIEKAIDQLLKHHDALRMSFYKSQEGWQQECRGLDEQPIPFSIVKLTELTGVEQQSTLEAIAGQTQASLNLTNGPLLRVVLFELETGQSYRLLWVIHHLVVDWVSWRILMEDFQQIYQQLLEGKAPSLPAKTTSFKQWSKLLLSYANSELTLNKDIPFWLAQGSCTAKRLPLDFPYGENTEDSMLNLPVALSQNETHALLAKAPQAYHTQINDLLLTALAQVFTNWTANNSVLIALEGHGREELFERVDLTRTVGWFTSLFPISLRLDQPNDVGQSLKSIKAQLSAIPRKGLSYGILRYLSSNQELAQQLKSLPEPEISFNYMGHTDQIWEEKFGFKLAKEWSGLPHSPLGKRAYLIDINGMVIEGQLYFIWTYSSKCHNRETIETLAQDFIVALQALIKHMTYAKRGKSK